MAVTKNETQNVTFHCTLEGKPLSTITWWHGNQMVITSDSKYTLKEPTIETGDTASLTITNLHRNDEGSYRCNATNQLTTVISDAATLTVHCKFISLFYKSRRTHASLKVQGMTWTVWQTDLSYECCYFILFKCALTLDIVCYVILYLIRCNNRETKEL